MPKAAGSTPATAKARYMSILCISRIAHREAREIETSQPVIKEMLSICLIERNQV